MRLSPGKSRLLASLFSFSSIQAAQLVLPLLALPWLARVLGPENFGLLMYFSLFPPLCALLMDWGLVLGVARAAASLRQDQAALGRLLGAMLGAKVILALACIGLSLLLWPFLPNTRLYPYAYALAVAAGIFRGTSPLPFVQGAAKGLWGLAILEVLCAFAVLVLALLCIHKPGQWPLYLLFLALLRALCYGTLLAQLAHTYAARPNLRAGWQILRETRQLFGAQLSTTSGASGAQLMLGYFLGASDMGIFVASSKMFRALTSMIHPLSQTIFPEICARHKNAPRLLLLSLAANFGLTALAASLAWLTAPWIIALAMGHNYTACVPVLRVMLLAAPFLTLNTALGEQLFTARNQERALTRVLALGALAAICLAVLLASLYGLNGAAWQPVLSEAGICLALLWSAKKYCLGCF